MSLLSIHQLSVCFGEGDHQFKAVDGLSLNVEAGEILGIVGESGSGKSVTMMAVMGLLEGQGKITADAFIFDGQPLLQLSPKQRRQIIGKDIAMIFQDPMTALNPSYTVGYQIKEVLRLHIGLKGKALHQRAIELMEKVGIPAAETRLKAYPHQLSGGMCQRVAIAMAMACEPKLLIADEPTTALDVTIQAQIMDLLLQLQQEKKMSLILITHDLAVVNEMAQRVAVMYAGQVVELGSVPDMFEHPSHPYTQALLSSVPEHAKGQSRLQTLPGIVPSQYDRPKGCLLSPRCPKVQEQCIHSSPPMIEQAHRQVRCLIPLLQESVHA